MTSQQTQAESNKAIIRRYRQAHNQNDMAALDEIVAVDLITHSQLPNVPSGREGGKMVHQGAVAAFPDGKVTTDDLIAEGDKVVERFTLVGTHKGDLPGMPATGKQMEVRGSSTFEFAGDRIRRCSDYWDMTTLHKQLGLMASV